MAAKPIKLYSHAGGPNPWKVAIILTELSLPYENVIMDFPSLKKPAFESINPNGRVPAIEDPNTGAKLWESGAIIEYLLEVYDGKNALHSAKREDRWVERCWAELQMSGQGPYFGQRAWFKFYHPQKDELCLERYGNEIRRVIGVLDAHLKDTGKAYLMGDNPSYVDLMYMPWHWLIAIPPYIMEESFVKEWQEKYPHAWAWHERVNARPAVEKVRKERAAALEAEKK